MQKYVSREWYRTLVRLCAFGDHVVYVPPLRPPVVLLDLGGHTGGFTNNLSRHFPLKGMIVEPSYELYGRILPPAGMIKRRLVIARDCGSASFNISSNPDASSLGAPIAGQVVSQQLIRSITADKLIVESGFDQIDILKMDIEGAEIAAIDSLSDDTLARVTQITVEFHSYFGMYEEKETLRTVQRLCSNGFLFMQFSDKSYTNSLFINRSRCRISRMEELFLRTISRRVMWYL